MHWFLTLRRPFPVQFATMMTSSNGNIFHVTGLLCGEFNGHQWIPRTKPVMRSFDVFLRSASEQQLSKRRRHRWFETPSLSLWRHCNAVNILRVWEFSDSISNVCYRCEKPLLLGKTYELWKGGRIILLIKIAIMNNCNISLIIRATYHANTIQIFATTG